MRVADREHDPVAEAVVALAFGLTVLRLVADDQPGFDQERFVVLGEGAGQPAPAVGGIAQAKAGRDLAAQATGLQVVDGALAFLELLLPVLGRGGHHIGQ